MCHGMELGKGNCDCTAEQIALADLWGYSQKRASEFPGHRDECTPKQSAYIRHLADKNPELARELEAVVNTDGRPGGGVALFACKKGQAMFVIHCFNGFFQRKRRVE